VSVAAVSATATRVQRLREIAAGAALDAIVVTNPSSIFYLTGFDGLQLERLFAVAIPVRGDGAFVLPRLDEEAAAAKRPPLEIVGFDAASDGFPELGRVLGGAGVVGVEEDHLPFARVRRLEQDGRELRPAGALVMDLRGRKDPAEIEAIRRACDVIAGEIERMFRELRPGDVERVVNARVDHRLAELGATETHALILFGPNAANPHGTPGDRPLEVGDVIVADVSARVNGYWGDLTRCGTVGPASDWARRTWDVVREAQAAAIEACRAWTPARDVDAAQRAIVERAADLGRCLHGAGHAVGTEIHEPPFLVPRTDAPLEAGMVLTIEPGLYASGVGGMRLEDDVVITDGDPVVLSRFGLELREVPA
jgi:Xaa-Pro dipeptidase